jgi:hypothetical protein
MFASNTSVVMKMDMESLMMRAALKGEKQNDSRSSDEMKIVRFKCAGFRNVTRIMRQQFHIFS